MQPDYTESAIKQTVRNKNIEKYRQITGLQSIPENRTYCTLASKQPNKPGSEIVQMVETGFLLPQQFHGVDRDEKIIKHNRQAHPLANWYHCEWLDFLQDVGIENAAMIYLDTTSFADHGIATSLVVNTMMISPPQCILFANVMMNDPRSHRHFDKTVLVKNICNQIPPPLLDEWNLVVENYDYSLTGRTRMKTFIFRKD